MDKTALLVLELFFSSSIEEIGDMGIFLRFCTVKLGYSLDREPFGQHIDIMRRGKQNREAEIRVVLGHCEDTDIFGMPIFGLEVLSISKTNNLKLCC